MPIADLTDTDLADLISLRGRVAVITGAAKGIGLAVARRLAEAGADVLLVDVDQQAAEQAASEIAERHGVRALATQADVAHTDQVEAAADLAVAELGRLDVWANIAGIYPVRAEEFQVTPDLDDAGWSRMIGINLDGTYRGARAAARRMIDAGNGGVILNTISTVIQKVPAPGLSHYAASKGGVEALTKSLAMELGGHGIRVLAICPTMVATPGMSEQKPVLTQAFGNQGDPWELYGSRLPLGRIAQPDDVARVALVAASDLTSIMTGSVLYADAGDLSV